MAASYVYALDVGGGTCSLELKDTGVSVVTWSYDDSTETVTFGAQTSATTLTLDELKLFVETVRAWMGNLFRAFRPVDTALLAGVRSLVTTATTIELDAATSGVVTLDAEYSRTTTATTFGTRAVAAMKWSDLKSLFAYIETFLLACTEDAA